MKCLILTFNDFWSPTKVTSHHFADYLISIGFRVLYVSDVISPFHLLRFDLFRLNLSKIIAVLTASINYQSSLISIIPFTLIPIRNNFPFNLKLCIKLQAISLKHYFGNVITNFLDKDKDFDLIWINNPKYYYLLRKINYKKLVYAIEDDLFEFSNIPQCLKKSHYKLMQEADLITVTSEPLFRKIKSLLNNNDKLILLRNGVNFTQFDRIDSSFIESDIVFKSIPKPRIIYIGAISHWFHFDLLAKVAISLPHCSFVIIGPSDVSIEKLKRLPNIYFLGSRPHAIIQNYLQAADIGIIPFLKTKLIESVNPIKLYEYMASGLPVVSTTWQEIENLNSPAFLAESSTEFTQHIIHILNNYPIDRESLISFAKSNLWETRFNQLMKKINLIDRD